MAIFVENQVLMEDNIEHIVCCFFGVDIDCLYTKSRYKCREETDALHFLFYILHYDFNLSSPRISKRYGKGLRHVKRCISKIKAGIQMQRYYRETYEGIMDKLKKGITDDSVTPDGKI